jgi:hypothetical protein
VVGMHRCSPETVASSLVLLRQGVGWNWEKAQEVT